MKSTRVLMGSVRSDFIFNIPITRRDPYRRVPYTVTVPSPVLERNLSHYCEIHAPPQKLRVGEVDGRKSTGI